MANVTTYKNDDVRDINTGISLITKVMALSSSAALNGDRIQVFKVPIGALWRLSEAQLFVSATLGVGTTVKLQVDRAGVYTDVTAATTAGGASKVSSAAAVDVPFNLVGGDILTLLVGGANITAAATATVDLEVSAR